MTHTWTIARASRRLAFSPTGWAPAVVRGASSTLFGPRWLPRSATTARVAIITALLSSLAVPSGAAAAPPPGDAPPAASAAGAGRGPKPSPSVWLQISAFTDAPVVGAGVAVRASLAGDTGPLLFEQRDATNDRGVFPAPLRAAPRAFRVVVSDGTTNDTRLHARLSADFENFDLATQTAAVNPVTTLVSLLLDRQPRPGLAGAQERVRRFLGLPVGSDLGVALRESAGYRSPFFSETAFMQEAQRRGGLAAFEESLVREMLASPTATHAFPPSGLRAGAFSFSTALANGAVSYLAGKGVGWALEQSGLVSPGATKDDILQLQNALADLQSSVANLAQDQRTLNAQLQAQITGSQYQQTARDALDIASQVNTVSQRLADFAAYCPPLADGSSATAPSTYCTTERQAILDNLNSTAIFGAYDRLANVYVKDNPSAATPGLLHLYSLWLYQARPFFRPADSNRMQQLFDYWDTVQIQAANLRVELWHAQGVQNDPSARKLLTDFLGDATTNPPTPGTIQKTRDEEVPLLKLPVPDGTVISTKDGAMWAVSGPLNFAIVRDPQPHVSYSPSPSCNTTNEPIPPNQIGAIAGLSNWDVATYPQWQAAVAKAPTGANWMDWLVQQTKAEDPDSPTSPGFFNFPARCNAGAWSSTVAQPFTCFGPGFYLYLNWVAHPDQNTFTGENRAAPAGVSCTAPTPGVPFANQANMAARAPVATEQYYWSQ